MCQVYSSVHCGTPRWKPDAIRAAMVAGAVECSIIRDDIAGGLVVDLPPDALGHPAQFEEGEILVRPESRRRFLVVPLEGESEHGGS